MSYNAIVAPIHVRPHPNADKLMIGTVMGYNVIVGKDTVDGQLGVFFPTDGALSHEYVHHNNGYRSGKGENADPAKSGFFEESRRVKHINLRGARGEGYWAPLDTLAWTGADLTKLKQGDQFTHLNDKLVCGKYYTKATRAAMKTQKSSIRKLEIPMFKKHFDTTNLRHAIYNIPQGARIIITEKLHGTSGRTGHVQVPRKLNWYQQILNDLYTIFTGWKASTAEWMHVSGTRNVILDPKQTQENGYYSGSTFRSQVHRTMSLRKGETLYYEIVGYDGLRDDGSSRTIMGSHSVSEKSKDEVDKIIYDRFGPKIDYTYGCTYGQFDVYVYRITHTNEDAEVVELSWDQVVARCKELGFKPVPWIATIVYDGKTWCIW